MRNRPRCLGVALAAGLFVTGCALCPRAPRVSPVSKNKIIHRVTVDLASPRRFGPPTSPGGFSSPDTIGIEPRMDFSVRQEVLLTGEFRENKPPLAKQIPLSYGVRVASLGELEPALSGVAERDTVHGRGSSGIMCVRPGKDGTYPIPVYTIDPFFLFSDSLENDSFTLPFDFDITTELVVPLQSTWTVIDPPVRTVGDFDWFAFDSGAEIGPGQYVRTFRLRVAKTAYSGIEAEKLRYVVDIGRRCANQRGRIRP